MKLGLWRMSKESFNLVQIKYMALPGKYLFGLVNIPHKSEIWHQLPWVNIYRLDTNWSIRYDL